MKNLILLLFFLIPLSMAAQIRLNDKLVTGDTIPEWYNKSTQKPSYVVKGTQITVMADTIYLMNGIRYGYYQKLQELKELIQTDSAEIIAMEMMKGYERAIDSCRSYYLELLKNAEKTDATSIVFINKAQETVVSAQTTLNNADKQLDLANKHLITANKNLDEAKALIHKSIRFGWLDKIIIGASCLLVGFAIGKL